MPGWKDVLAEIQGSKPVHPIDQTRRKYLKKLSDKTGRNVIAYYSAWLNQPKMHPSFVINDEDKNAFMSAVHQLDRTKGLDLILHTPGGDLAATESIVDYLRQMFGIDIRAIIPQVAMSAGTMIACSCKSIIMGKQSNLGPIDPQLGGIPANGVLAEFKEALKQVKKDPAAVHLWQTIIGKYHPTFLGSCENAIEWSKKIVTEWLKTAMFNGEPNASQKASKVVRSLSSSNVTFNHARHIHVDTLMSLGLKIEQMEHDQELQDLILTVHHTFMHTFGMTGVLKIVENHDGVAFVKAPQQQRD